MRALRKLESGGSDLHVCDVPMGEPGRGEVRVAVRSAGICGTDLHIIDGSYACLPPVTLGHEFTGVVDAVGPLGLEEWIGRRVAVEPAVGCGFCEWCSAGYPMHCRARRSLGTHLDGGFAEFAIVPERNLHQLPSGLSDSAGALVEPLACVCNALFDPSWIAAGERVIVTGPGTIGIIAAQVAQALGGAVTLVGLDRDADRLALAAGLSIDCMSLDDGDAYASLDEEVSNRGIHVVIECAGAPAALEWGLRALRPRGRLIQLGLLPEHAPVDFAPAVLRELLITSSFGSTPSSWRKAISLLTSRTIQLEPLITRTVAFENWREAARLASAAEGVKTVFDPRLS